MCVPYTALIYERVFQLYIVVHYQGNYYNMSMDGCSEHES